MEKDGRAIIAHRDGERLQTLDEHLEGVARLAEQFGAVFDAGSHAYRCGLLHDLGKATEKGQKRMWDPEHTAKVDHSTAGAYVAKEKLRDPYAAFVIAGHHSGLMDMGNKMSISGDGTLMGRLKSKFEKDYAEFEEHLSLEKQVNLPTWLDSKEASAFYIRMLFSCLVDADFLDTEAFMRGENSRGTQSTMEELYARLEEYVKGWFPPKGEINRKRCEILKTCMEGGFPRGMYTLTVPTGGGKTVSSLAFALSHAKEHGHRRIIYVIPYTSIIEQNAEVFRNILGEENVLEHHANADYPETEDEEDEIVRRRRKATENWDAPVIVTTAVQFFESLYGNRSSKCRKNHNISDSVIIFDEAQMLPLPYLEACVYVIGELVRHYKVTAVLCTATQPSLNRMISQSVGEQYVPTEICGNTLEMTHFFRRVRFDRITGEIVDNGRLAEILGEKNQVLCIVNTRKKAAEIYRQLPEEGSFHLSTMMTPVDRKRNIARIRECLKDGKTCRVISTSLIEAGVDVDFPEVWREEAGLDSILQAAGRCNREGKRSRDDSRVVVFRGEGKVPPLFAQQVEAMRSATEGVTEIDMPEIIRSYFDVLLKYKENTLDSREIRPLSKKFRFRTIAESFHLIDDDTKTVLVPDEDCQKEISRLRCGMYDRKDIRRLQMHAVNVYEKQYEALLESGALEIVDDAFAVLTDASRYDPQTGLDPSEDSGNALFV